MSRHVSFSILSLRYFLTYGFPNLSDNWSVMGTFVLFFLCVFAQLLITCRWQGNYQQNQTYKYSVSMTQQYNINGFVGQWNELIWQLSFLWLGETLWKNVGILLCTTDLDSVGCFWLKIPTGLLWLQARSPPPNDTWVCLFSTYQLTSFK